MMQGIINCFVKLFVCLIIGKVFQIFVCSLGRSCLECLDIQCAEMSIGSM